MVWHHSLLLMKSFNKTEAAVFSCRLCFLRAIPFISLIKHCILYYTNRKNLNSGVKRIFNIYDLDPDWGFREYVLDLSLPNNALTDTVSATIHLESEQLCYCLNQIHILHF